MQAIIVKFNLEYKEQQQHIKTLLDFLVRHPWYEYNYYRVWEDGARHSAPHIAVKHDNIEEIKHLFRWNDKSVEYTKEYYVCEETNCYKEIAANNFNGFLFNRHGEEPHEIHNHCHEHIKTSSRLIFRNIEAIDENPGEKDDWQKINVWCMRNRWYAQRIQQEWEYEDYGISHPYLEATPWIGPHTDRDAAIEAARAYSN